MIATTWTCDDIAEYSIEKILGIRRKRMYRASFLIGTIERCY